MDVLRAERRARGSARGRGLLLLLGLRGGLAALLLGLDGRPPARGLVVRGVDQHHVAGVDGALDLRALPLRVLLVRLAVLPAQVHALDDDAPAVAHDRLDRAALAPVVAGDHDDEVSLADVHHTTSWASEMIFMKLRSRSSRATAPKIRVPRGLPSGSIRTSAFRSKRT